MLDIEDDAGAKSARDIAALPGAGQTAYFRCDVGFKDQVDRVFAAVLARFGKVDILVNNAGIMRRADFLELSEQDFDDVIRTNLKSVFLLGQVAAKHMVERGECGAITTTSAQPVAISGAPPAPGRRVFGWA